MMDKAATRIACIYRGLKTRRQLQKVIKARKSATLLIQALVRKRILKMRKLAKEKDAATLIQRYCKGHMVAKHYVHLLGDISIDKSLHSLTLMKKEIGYQLAKSLYFYWQIYKRNKERKAKEEAERKKKKAAKGKKKKGRAQSFAVKAPKQSSFSSKSVMSASIGSTNNANSGASIAVKRGSAPKKIVSAVNTTDLVINQSQAEGDPIEEPESPMTEEMKALQAEAKQDDALRLLGGVFAMGKIPLQSVVEEDDAFSRRQSPRDSVSNSLKDGTGDRDREMDEEGEQRMKDSDSNGSDIDRADISTRGLNKGVGKDKQYNDALDLQQIPQVEILDTTKNYLVGPDGDTDEEAMLNRDSQGEFLGLPRDREDSHNRRIEAMLEQVDDPSDEDNEP